MNSKLLSASVLALSALASANSFAESGDYVPPVPYGQSVSNVTRAEVRAELFEAKRDGLIPGFVNDSTGPIALSQQPADTKTRAEVRAELMAARPLPIDYSVDHDYPVIQ